MSSGRAILPWQIVHVSGPSMTPTLRDGDRVLIWHGLRVRPGDIVLARFRALPDLWVIKRAAWGQDGGWWLRSDNVFAGGDSDTHGVANVAARAVAVLRGGHWWRLQLVPPAPR